MPHPRILPLLALLPFLPLLGCASRPAERIRAIKTAALDGAWEFGKSSVDAHAEGTLLEYDSHLVYFPGLRSFQGNLGDDGIDLRSDTSVISFGPDGLDVDGRRWPLSEFPPRRRRVFADGELR